MTKQEFYNKYDFRITDNPNIRDKDFNITPKITKILNTEYEKIQMGKTAGMVKRIKSLIGKYPDVPQFKNYLSVLYEKNGQLDLAFDNMQKTLETHPNYLFAKINLAKRYFHNEQYEMGRRVLGNNLKISEFSPESEVFYTIEVINYYDAVFRYYIDGKGDDRAAQEVLALMEAVDIEHSLTNRCMKSLMAFRLGKMTKRIENRREYETQSFDKSLQTTQAPTFQFPEIQELYQNDLRIDQNILKNILSLPREALIKDLEKVVWDSVCRFEYFEKRAIKNGWDDKELSFPIHAFFLLTELKAKESLPVLWKALSHDYDISDFWYNDFLTESLWFDFYQLGNDNLDFLKACLIAPKVDQFCKAPAHQALTQIAHHQTNRREEILTCYDELFEHFLEEEKEGKPIDTGLIASLIDDLMELKAKDKLPAIRTLFEKGMVDEFIVGKFTDVQNDLLSDEEFPQKWEVYDSIFERIDYILKNWFSYSEKAEKDKTPLLLKENLSLPSAANPKVSRKEEKPKPSKKIGRNDPCVCGSGKKFKKCCIKNYK